MQRSLRFTFPLVFALLLWGLALPAMAHHPLGGMPMQSFGDGVLSGLAHPVLGFDHLAFVVAVGLCALRSGSPALAPAAYIASMLVGCVLMPLGVSMPGKEVFVALSLLVLGGVVLSARNPNPKLSIALFAFFGLFHGSALGDSLGGSEATVGGAVLMGYLLGLGLVQYLVARGSARLVDAYFGRSEEASELHLRLAGAMVAGVGIFLSAERLEGAALGLLGWG